MAEGAGLAGWRAEEGVTTSSSQGGGYGTSSYESIKRFQAEEHERKKAELRKAGLPENWYQMSNEARAVYLEEEKRLARLELAITGFNAVTSWTRSQHVHVPVAEIAKVDGVNLRHLLTRRHRGHVKLPADFMGSLSRVQRPVLDFSPVASALFANEASEAVRAWAAFDTIWPTSSTLAAKPFNAQSFGNGRVPHWTETWSYCQSRRDYWQLVKGPFLRPLNLTDCGCIWSRIEPRPSQPMEARVMIVAVWTPDGSFRNFHVDLGYLYIAKGKTIFTTITFLQLRQVIAQQLGLEDLLCLEMKWIHGDREARSLFKDYKAEGTVLTEVNTDKLASFAIDDDNPLASHATQPGPEFLNDIMLCRISQYFKLEVTMATLKRTAIIHPSPMMTVGELRKLAAGAAKLGHHRGGVIYLWYKDQLLDNDTIKLGVLGLALRDVIFAREEKSACGICSTSSRQVSTKPTSGCRVCRICMHVWISTHMSRFTSMACWKPIRCPECDVQLSKEELEMYASKYSLDRLAEWRSRCALLQIGAEGYVPLFQMDNFSTFYYMPFLCLDKRQDPQEQERISNRVSSIQQAFRNFDDSPSSKVEWFRVKLAPPPTSSNGVKLRPEPTEKMVSDTGVNWNYIRDSHDAVFCQNEHCSLILSLDCHINAEGRYLAKLDMKSIRTAIAHILAIDDASRVQLSSSIFLRESCGSDFEVLAREEGYRSDEFAETMAAKGRPKCVEGSEHQAQDRCRWKLRYRIVDYLTLKFTPVGYTMAIVPYKNMRICEVVRLVNDAKLGFYVAFMARITFQGRVIESRDNMKLQDLGCRHGDVLEIEAPFATPRSKDPPS